MSDLDKLNKVEDSFTQDELVKKLINNWNSQYTQSESGNFAQINTYLSALFQLSFLGTNREIREIKKEFRDMKEDLCYDTQLLLQEGFITVNDIKELSVLFGGKVIATLKGGKKVELYTRNELDRELMLVNKKSQINLTRPGIEEYYNQHKEEYPGIMKINDLFKIIPNPTRLSYKFNSKDVGEYLYKKLQFTPQKLMALLKEYRRFHKECPYQLCHEKYRGTN